MGERSRVAGHVRVGRYRCGHVSACAGGSSPCGRDRREDRAAARGPGNSGQGWSDYPRWLVVGLDDEGRQRWKVMLRNDSDRPVFGVRIHTLCAVATEGASAAPMRSITTVQEEDYSLEPSLMISRCEEDGGEWWRIRTLWTAVDSYEKPVAKGVASFTTP